MNLRFAALTAAACAAALPVLAQAGTFTLNANAEAYNHNDGGTFIGDPKTASFTAPGTGNVASQVTLTDPVFGDITAFQNIDATLTDEFHGSVHYNDGWTTNNLTAGQVRMWSAISTYEFTLMNPGQVDILWNASFVGLGSNDISFGIDDIIVYIDGTMYDAPWQWPPTTNGSIHQALGAGAHTIAFQDFSNLFGQLATQTASVNETLEFSISESAVPEPASIAALALGASSMLLRRRRR